MKKHGLKESDYIVDFAINPPSAAIAVFSKAADAAGVGEVILNLSAIKERIDVSQLKVLAKGDELPMLCWAVKKEMSKETAEKIKKAMIGLKNDEECKKILKEAEATAFVPASDKDYELVRKIVKEALGEEY
ncbi:MAG: PhnD/SsuA/transferrin family substrate-binding protein [Nitrospirota bacterium]